MRPYPGTGPTGGRVDRIEVQTKTTAWYIALAEDMNYMWSEGLGDWTLEQSLASKWLLEREAEYYRSTRDLGSLTELVER